MPERSIVHGSFTIERTYPVPPARVFNAWADKKQKAKWFGDPANPQESEIFEFREGGREYLASDAGGARFTFDVSYRDIVPDNRIVYSYEMSLNGRRMSVSVATIEFRPEGAGSTKMVLHEMGAFLDGLDTNEQRHDGTEQLIRQLAAYLGDGK
jgi:uncharacterized protein YndB with AHSA1/START domain